MTLGAAFLAIFAAPVLAQSDPFSVDAESVFDRPRMEYMRYAMGETQQVMDAWEAAWDRDNAPAAMRLYTDDAVLLVGHDNQFARGSDALLKTLQEWFDDADQLRVGIADFAVSGEQAYGMGPLSYEVVGPDGAVARVSGTYVMIFQRVNGRTWRIRSHIFRPDSAPTG